MARKVHYCSCGHRIPAGHVYLSHVLFPGEWHDGPGPRRSAECSRCACRYGRELDLGDMPYEQLASEGLL